MLELIEMYVPRVLIDTVAVVLLLTVTIKPLNEVLRNRNTFREKFNGFLEGQARRVSAGLSAHILIHRPQNGCLCIHLVSATV